MEKNEDNEFDEIKEIERKEKEKEYNRNYYKNHKKDILFNKNKEAPKEQRRVYRNLPEIKKKLKHYRSTEEYRIKHNELNKKHYWNNQERYTQKSKDYKNNRKKICDEIKIHYKCKNGDCKWSYEFKPCQLEFHHFDKTTKKNGIAMMLTGSRKKLIEEINKCIVLCSNCHAAFHAGFVKLDKSMMCKVDDDFKPIKD